MNSEGSYREQVANLSPPLPHPHAHPIMPVRLVQGSQEPIWPMFTEYMYVTVEWELKHIADGHLNQFTYSSLKSLFSRLAWHLYLVLFFFFLITLKLARTELTRSAPFCVKPERLNQRVTKMPGVQSTVMPSARSPCLVPGTDSPWRGLKDGNWRGTTCDNYSLLSGIQKSHIKSCSMVLGENLSKPQSLDL